jgi:hypothetical protein
MATKIEFLEATVAELTKDNSGIKQVLDLKQNERFKVEAKVNLFIYLFIYLLSFAKSSIVTLGIYVHFT